MSGTPDRGDRFTLNCSRSNAIKRESLQRLRHGQDAKYSNIDRTIEATAAFFQASAADDPHVHGSIQERGGAGVEAGGPG